MARKQRLCVKQGSLKHQEGERQNDGKKCFSRAGKAFVLRASDPQGKAFLKCFSRFFTDFHGLVTDFHGLFTIFHAKRVPASVNDTAAAHRPIELPLPRLAKEGSVSMYWRLLFLSVGKVRPPV